MKQRSLPKNILLRISQVMDHQWLLASKFLSFFSEYGCSISKSIQFWTTKIKLQEICPKRSKFQLLPTTNTQESKTLKKVLVSCLILCDTSYSLKMNLSLIPFSSIHKVPDFSCKLTCLPKSSNFRGWYLFGIDSIPIQMMTNFSLIFFKPFITTNTSPLFFD